MAEFTSLNGFMVKDATARNIAKGRNQAVAFVDYATMIEALNEFEKDEYRAGQNVYIGVVGVPDLWVYSVEDIRHTFEYVSDEEVVDKLKTYTTIQVGFFKLAMLEGQKVDLTTYDQHLAKHDDDITELNNDVEEINNSLTASDNLKFRFSTDGEGNYGYLGADDSFIPFSNLERAFKNKNLIYSLDKGAQTVHEFTTTKAYKNLLVCGIAHDGTTTIWMRISNDKELEFNEIFSIVNKTTTSANQRFDVKIGMYHDVPENTTISFDVRLYCNIRVYELID